MIDWLQRLSPRLATRWVAIQESFWLLPALFAVVAALLSEIAIEADQSFSYDDSSSWLLFADSPEGARAMLTTIATASITVAGVAFSITIVALTLASSQFGPRLLQHFMRDRGNQVVLGTYIASFLYSLLVLRSVGDSEPFVPRASITLSLAFAVAGVAVLIYFLHHAATSINAANVVDGVGDELEAAIERFFPATAERDGVDTAAAGARHGEETRILATGGGYLQAVDTDTLLEIAVAQQLVVHSDVRPGKYVPLNGELAVVSAARELDTLIAAKVREQFILGRVRTAEQDVEFAIEQLVEVAVRALSPGVNDPFTAIHCIDRLASALAALPDRADPRWVRTDEDGATRVALTASSQADVVASAFDQIRQTAREHVSVTVRLLEQLTHLAGLDGSTAFRGSLVRQVDAIEAVLPAIFAPADRTDIDQRLARFRFAIQQSG